MRVARELHAETLKRKVSEYDDRGEDRSAAQRPAAADPLVRSAAPAHVNPSLALVMSLQRSAGNRAVQTLLAPVLQRMVVTAENPESDPLTVAVLPMAKSKGQPPVHKFERALDYHEAQTIIYLGHGQPGGELTKVDRDELLSDFADEEKGVAEGTTLEFWTCYSSQRGVGVGTDESLIEQTRKKLDGAGRRGIKIIGSPGALYSDTHRDKLWSGPGKGAAHQAEIVKLEQHYWVESGLAPQDATHHWRDGWTPKTVALEIDLGDSKLTGNLKKLGMLPFTLDIACENLRRARKIPEIPESAEDKRQAVTDAVKEWYRMFFDDPLVQELVKRGIITEGSAARIQITTS
jgi:hypothetical protein